jgi:hypothetical protein
MKPRDVARTLSRLIRGEVTSIEAQRLALRAGFGSFSELCGTRLPGGRKRLRITRRHVLERIDRYRHGDARAGEIWRWADELYHIAIARQVSYVPREEPLVSTALAVLSVICNEGLFPHRGKLERQLEVLRRALIRGGGLRLERVFGRAFEDLPRAHLVDRYAEEQEGAEAVEPRHWTDVVMIDRPFRLDADVLGEANWVIAFTVYSAELFGQHEQQRALEVTNGTDRIVVPRPGRADRVPVLQNMVPNFAFDRYNPRYMQDTDGIAEIVLEADSIGPAEVEYATKLFALVNRLRAVWLDGQPLRTLLVHPGDGGSRRRAG